MISKQVIKQNFSRFAGDYDRYCNVQNLCALELIAKVQDNGFKSILDVGCGTGNFTGLLRKKFPYAKIKALDISENMVRVAKDKLAGCGVEFIVADAECAGLKDKFDFISSNASFQWFADLEQTLEKFFCLLNSKGIILFSLFGPRTFCELHYCLGDKQQVAAGSFKTKEEIESILQKLFKDIEIEQWIYRERYASLKGLLKKIKYTGTRGDKTVNKSFWSLGMVREIEQKYKKDFKEITATYQVFFCRGVK